jgi:hypothetical protein
MNQKLNSTTDRKLEQRTRMGNFRAQQSATLFFQQEHNKEMKISNMFPPAQTASDTK